MTTRLSSKSRKIVKSELDGQPELTVVRLNGDLSAAAFRSKQADELAMWHCLRAINSSGSGVLDTGYTLTSLSAVFNYSERQAYRLLQNGNGRFWQRDAHRIVIYGLRRVCQYLDTCLEFHGHWQGCQASDFKTTLKRRAQLYYSIHKPSGIQAAPISRESISEYTGLSKTQQRRYERMRADDGTLPVHRTPNYAVHGGSKGIGKRINTQTGFPELYAKQPTTAVKMVIVTKAQGAREIQKRLGNTFHSQQIPDFQGMIPKVRRSLHPARSLLPEEAQAGTVDKLFFGSFNKMLRNLSNRHKGQATGAFFKVHPCYRMVRARQEWGVYDAELP